MSDLTVPIAMLSGGGGLWMARDYLRRRFSSPEDRYMELYARAEWRETDMDLTIRFDPAADVSFKQDFTERLSQLLGSDKEEAKLLRETAVLDDEKIAYHTNPDTTTAQLLAPRNGVYFDYSKPGEILVIWNHLQCDGVGLWRTLRVLFDDNPPLIPYQNIRIPPPWLPEFLALPSVFRRLIWQGRLRKDSMGETIRSRGDRVWPSEWIRDLRRATGNAPFNLVTSAMAVREVFDRHPQRKYLTVGLTAYFPFLQSRNKYSVFLCKVRRGNIHRILAQLKDQTSNRLLSWGQSAVHMYALNRMPDRAFDRLANHFRRKVDVLISSLPVGQKPITVGNTAAQINSYPLRLTVPYYFLFVGTRQEVHVSYTSHFEEKGAFLAPQSMHERWVQANVPRRQSSSKMLG